MIWWLDLMLFAVLVATAVLALRTRDLLTAVGLMGVFGLVAALLFTSMQALDVTFVEAALGAGVTGVLLITAVLHTTRRTTPVGRRSRLSRWFIVPLIGLLALVLYTTTGLPDRGDTAPPGAAGVYIERSLADTQTPNVVTAILADYRGHDTLGETLVIVVAAAATMLILRRRPDESAAVPAETVVGPHGSEVVRVVSAHLVPFVATYGLYVIAHGHYGPGGGFVGGAILAVAAILLCLTARDDISRRVLPRRLGPVAIAAGALVYLAAGIAPMAADGNFLDYGVLASGDVLPARARYLMILIVEIGVGLAVFGAMLTIFDQLTGRHRRTSTPTAPTEGEAAL